MAFAPRILLLFALVLAACTGGADDLPPSASSTWRAATSTDSTGTVRNAFLARDAEGNALADRLFPPALLLRCDDGLTAVYIDWGTDLGRDTVSVTYSLDDHPEHTEQWITSSGREAAGWWTDSLAMPLIRDLIASHRLRVTTETATGSQTWAFSLDGLGDASEPMREACKWDSTLSLER